MKKICVWLLILFILAGCGTSEPETAVVEAPPEPTAFKEEPTEEPKPEVSIPGAELISMDSLKPEIPWLEYDPSQVPSAYHLRLNVYQTPLDDVNVRRALSMALDRERIAQGAATRAQDNQSNFLPASTITPPTILSRDLYGVVGLIYDPEGAREALKDAGYENGEGFPEVELVYYSPNTDELAASIVSEWKAILNIDVKATPYTDSESFYGAAASDAPVMYMVGWTADLMDPKNFLLDQFQVDYPYENSVYFDLVNEAGELTDDPQARLMKYIEAEEILCEDDVRLMPLYSFLIAK